MARRPSGRRPECRSGDGSVTRAARHCAQRGTSARSVGRAVADLYAAHYQAMVRMTVLLVDDVTVAEQIVQDGFVDTGRAWRRLDGGDGALFYLRRRVLARARWHRAAGAGGWGGARCRRAAVAPAGDLGLAGLLAVLGTLSGRQREALVLRYYVGLPNADIARLMSVPVRSVTGQLGSAVTAFEAARRGRQPPGGIWR